MKKILIILIIATFSCKAQSPIISMVDYTNNDDIELTENCYLKDVENKFDTFLGTWQWEDGSNSFTIVFEKIEQVFEGEYYVDFIIGKYKYIENGIEIVNTLDFNDINTTDMYKVDALTNLIRGSDYTEDDYQELNFYDRIKEKRCKASFEITEYSTNHVNGEFPLKARWKLWDIQRTVIDGQFETPVGFSIPTDVELIKQ